MSDKDEAGCWIIRDNSASNFIRPPPGWKDDLHIMHPFAGKRQHGPKPLIL